MAGVYPSVTIVVPAVADLRAGMAGRAAIIAIVIVGDEARGC